MLRYPSQDDVISSNPQTDNVTFLDQIKNYVGLGDDDYQKPERQSLAVISSSKPPLVQKVANRPSLPVQTTHQHAVKTTNIDLYAFEQKRQKPPAGSHLAAAVEKTRNLNKSAAIAKMNSASIDGGSNNNSVNHGYSLVHRKALSNTVIGEP